MHARAFSKFTPPMASTGISTDAQTSRRRSIPCGGPNAALDGVANTGPKKMKFAPPRSAARADSREWQETPIRKSDRPAERRHSTTVSSGKDFSPR